MDNRTDKYDKIMQGTHKRKLKHHFTTWNNFENQSWFWGHDDQRTSLKTKGQMYVPYMRCSHLWPMNKQELVRRRCQTFIRRQWGF